MLVSEAEFKFTDYLLKFQHQKVAEAYCEVRGPLHRALRATVIQSCRR